jgi:hypothetical protein
LHDRHRDFGEVVEHQIVDWSTFNLAHGCVKKISPESLSGSYAYFFFHQDFWNLSDATQKHKKGLAWSSAKPFAFSVLGAFVIPIIVAGLDSELGSGSESALVHPAMDSALVHPVMDWALVHLAMGSALESGFQSASDSASESEFQSGSDSELATEFAPALDSQSEPAS